MEHGAAVLRDRIPSLASAISIKTIVAGYSTDEKYLVTSVDGTKSVLRLSPIESHRRQEEQVRALRHLEPMGVRAPKPLEVGRLDDLGRTYCVLSYIDGEAAIAALPSCPRDAQYQIGVQAGRDLVKMHQLVAPPTTRPWRERAMEKHRRYLDAYRTCGVRLENDEEIGAFIEANGGALENRPDRFQHGDFHVSNIIVKDQLYAGTVDFDRHDWGDPFQEFMKIGFFSRGISVPFCLGQIHGYFGDRGAPEEFWRLYAVYVAMGIFSSVVWALRSTPHQVQEMVDLLSRVVDDHDGFESIKPRWYEGS